MVSFTRFWKKLIQEEDAATAIEYALIAAATGLALAATLPLIQTNLGLTYSSILNYFTTVGV